MGNIITEQLDFSSFYQDHFIPEHSHPANIALHIVGTLAGLALIVAGLTVIPIWWVLLFPLIHVGPGLIGHRLFDRSEEVGDLRVLRKDFPLWWFLIANHVLTARFAGRLFGLKS